MWHKQKMKIEKIGSHSQVHETNEERIYSRIIMQGTMVFIPTLKNGKPCFHLLWNFGPEISWNIRIRGSVLRGWLDKICMYGNYTRLPMRNMRWSKCFSFPHKWMKNNGHISFGKVRRKIKGAFCARNLHDVNMSIRAKCCKMQNAF